MNIRALLIVAAGCAAAPSAQAQPVDEPAPGADLIEVYRDAEGSDPQLRAARAEFQAVQTQRPQVRSGLLPNVEVGGDVFRNRFDDRSTGDVTWSTSQGLSLDLTQAIYNRALFHALDQADASIAQASAQFASAEQGLALRAAESYFTVLSAETELQYAIARREATSRQLEQARKRFEVGLIAITDVNEAQALYDAALADVIAAENNLANAEEALRELTGRYYTELEDLREDMPLVVPEPANMRQWADTALEQNLDVRAAEFFTEVARQEIEVQRSGRYPTLNAGASHGYSEDSFGGLFTNRERITTSIGLTLRVPFYQGGGVTARTSEARYLFQQAQENLDAQRRSTLRATHDAFRGVETGIGRVQALRQAIVSARSALEATEAGFEVGTRTIVDVLIAQENLFLAQRDYHQARYEYVLNILRLKQAAGILSPEDLAAVNQYLVPDPDDAETRIGMEEAPARER